MLGVPRLRGRIRIPAMAAPVASSALSTETKKEKEGTEQAKDKVAQTVGKTIENSLCSHTQGIIARRYRRHEGQSGQHLEQDRARELRSAPP